MYGYVYGVTYLFLLSFIVTGQHCIHNRLIIGKYRPEYKKVCSGKLEDYNV